MTMTDPIADFLTRLRNANSAYHDEVTLPHSKIKANIAEILKRRTRRSRPTSPRSSSARVTSPTTTSKTPGWARRW